MDVRVYHSLNIFILIDAEIRYHHMHVYCSNVLEKWAIRNMKTWVIQEILLVDFEKEQYIWDDDIFLHNSQTIYSIDYGCINICAFLWSNAMHRSRRAGTGVCSPPAELRNHLFVPQTTIVHQRKNLWLIIMVFYFIFVITVPSSST